MLYAILCYNTEAVVGALNKEQDAALMARLGAVREKLAAQGKVGPTARLMPTTTAVTLRGGRDSLVLDGPFAETKEALLGFWIVDCASLDEAIEIARLWEHENYLAKVPGAHEIRPVAAFDPGPLRK